MAVIFGVDQSRAKGSSSVLFDDDNAAAAAENSVLFSHKVDVTVRLQALLKLRENAIGKPAWLVEDIEFATCGEIIRRIRAYAQWPDVAVGRMKGQIIIELWCEK